MDNQLENICDCRSILLKTINEHKGDVMIRFGLQGKIIVRNVSLHDCFCNLPPKSVCSVCFEEFLPSGPILRAFFYMCIKKSIIDHCCSVECCDKHDKIHKKIGRLVTNIKKLTCYTCHTYRGKMKKCGKCQQIYYCSIKCQKENWLEHKKICIAKKHEKIRIVKKHKKIRLVNRHENTTNSPSINMTNMCMTCYKRRPNMGLCEKCHQVYYCSTKCQIEDWEKHKRICRNEPNI